MVPIPSMIVKLLFFVAITELCAARHFHNESTSVGIAGGSEAVPHSLKNMVFIILESLDEAKKSMICGGSLIKPRFVLTAAHCAPCDKNIRLILGGAHDFSKDEPSQQIFHVEKFQVHPLHNKETLEHDMCIIKLRETAKLNKYVQVVKLPPKNRKSYASESVKVYGWGRLSERAGDCPTALQVVQLQVIQNDACSGYYANIHDTDFCTFAPGKKATRTGDSGGPIMWGEYQIGVVSRGGVELKESNPSVACSIPHHLSWIYETLEVL